MKIITILNDIASENTYILVNQESVIVIDPGSNAKKILKTIQDEKKPVSAILLTHTHYDHIMSLDLVRKTFENPPVYVSSKEASWLYNPKDNLSGHIRHNDIPDIITTPAENLFQYQKDYHIGGFTFAVRETPGHSIGGVSIIFNKEEVIFSGDALFKESIGRYDLPTGNYQQLIDSIKNQLFTLPNPFTVYPGHGQKTSIGHEKNMNPFLK
ncbi:MBL fold metallo-hydrolase [Streptococcus uberis]|uniref:MBL fold metallo-hydrolase n=1 Tax=Streptococcus uberis TaxID=1349 RepID=UPI001939BF32|nr:MBL fold metallo-hydrolase [Streptococcus uberis]